MPFVPSTWLVVVVRTFSTILNKSGESGQPYILPDIKGNIFSFALLNKMLAVSFSYLDFIMLKYVPSISTLLAICIIHWCQIISNAFSASIDMIM